MVPVRHILSTVHRGVAFEERSRLLLHHNLSMSLRRVGGKSDGGIDLLGWWWLPSSLTLNGKIPVQEVPRRRLRVLAQCKAEKKKLGPRHVREMEGVLYQYAHSQTSLNGDHVTGYAQIDPLVALLISESPFTKATTLRAQSSSVPFFLLHLPPQYAQESDPTAVDHGLGATVFWNPALAGSHGILRGNIEMRWERSPTEMGRPSLWWQDQRINSWTPEVDDTQTSS